MDRALGIILRITLTPNTGRRQGDYGADGWECRRVYLRAGYNWMERKDRGKKGNHYNQPMGILDFYCKITYMYFWNSSLNDKEWK